MYSVGFDVDGKPDYTLPESSSKIRPELPPLQSSRTKIENISLIMVF